MPAPTTILVYTYGGSPTDCRSIAQLDETLDRLHAERCRKVAGENACPLLTSISFPGHEVYLGVGADAVPVSVAAEPFDDWHYAICDEPTEGDKVMFYGAGDDTYWAPSHLIPIAVARDIVRYYVQHQQRSGAVRWEF